MDEEVLDKAERCDVESHPRGFDILFKAGEKPSLGGTLFNVEVDGVRK
jgi:hypothetical protein